MRIALGCDHNGFNLKQVVIELLQELGHGYHDFGCYSTDAVDYPDVAQSVAQAVAEHQFEHGILICGTGVGMSIAANKVKGIRAAVCHDPYTAKLVRQHNDANILCFGGFLLGPGVARELVGVFLGAEFEGGRHARRVEKIARIEFGEVQSALEHPRVT